MNKVFMELPRRQRHCVGCSEPFADKQEYHSTLEWHEDVEYVRSDFCGECFATVVAAEKFPVVWTGTVVGSPPKKHDDTDRLDNLLAYLRDAATKPERVADAFFAALYLARKKVIVFRSEILRPDKRLLWIYEVAATEEMLMVEKVPLMHLHRADVQPEVLELLQQGHG